MYIPTKYNEPEWKEIEHLIKAYPLATVITNVGGKIEANHIPFYLKVDGDKTYLQAHVSKANPQLPAWRDNDDVLVIFQSRDSYITPNYYPSKQETHKFVPTWDFGAVHISGKSRVIDDTSYVRTQLDNLTLQEETKVGSDWKVSDAPESYVTLKQKAIIGLQIEVVSTECKYKFDQDMKSDDVNGVIHGLKGHGKEEVSDLVKTTSERTEVRKAAKAAEKAAR